MHKWLKVTFVGVVGTERPARGYFAEATAVLSIVNSAKASWNLTFASSSFSCSLTIASVPALTLSLISIRDCVDVAPRPFGRIRPQAAGPRHAASEHNDTQEEEPAARSTAHGYAAPSQYSTWRHCTARRCTLTGCAFRGRSQGTNAVEAPVLSSSTAHQPPSLRRLIRVHPYPSHAIGSRQPLACAAVVGFLALAA